MSTSEACQKCAKRGSPDPACNPRTCTVVFGFPPAGHCANCGKLLDASHVECLPAAIDPNLEYIIPLEEVRRRTEEVVVEAVSGAYHDGCMDGTLDIGYTDGDEDPVVRWAAREAIRRYRLARGC